MKFTSIGVVTTILALMLAAAKLFVGYEVSWGMIILIWLLPLIIWLVAIVVITLGLMLREVYKAVVNK